MSYGPATALEELVGALALGQVHTNLLLSSSPAPSSRPPASASQSFGNPVNGSFTLDVLRPFTLKRSAGPLGAFVFGGGRKPGAEVVVVPATVLVEVVGMLAVVLPARGAALVVVDVLLLLDVLVLVEVLLVVLVVVLADVLVGLSVVPRQ